MTARKPDCDLSPAALQFWSDLWDFWLSIPGGKPADLIDKAAERFDVELIRRALRPEVRATVGVRALARIADEIDGKGMSGGSSR